LQNKNAVKDAVPFAGEIMASRWAFEALAVEQFKENRYMARFFEMDQEMARARYRSEILTTQLIGQVDLVDGWMRLDKPEEEISKKLLIIKNEIEKLDDENNLPEFRYTESLVPGKFTPEIAELTKEHLSQLQDFYDKRLQQVKLRKDRLINELEKVNGEQFIYNQKMKFHNKSLEALVLNSEAEKYYRETPEGYLQLIAPIYKEPDFENGRAHFLAAQKNLFGYTVGTFTFNVSVIWLMSLTLYIALYYNWLRKLLGLSDRLKMIKKAKKRT
jgi:ABC transport system ATP-binding/permease protein